MRKIPASLVAMLVAWASIMAGYAGWEATHKTKFFMMLGVTFATAACSLAAWLVIVLPLIWWWGDCKILSDLRWSWLGWMLMGVVSFPPGYDVHDIRHLAQGKGGGCRAHPTRCPMHMLNHHL